MARLNLVGWGFDENQATSRILSGSVSREGAIVQEANEVGYCTITVGRKGLSKVPEFAIGGVSNKVVQLAREQVVWVVN